MTTEDTHGTAGHLIDADDAGNAGNIGDVGGIGDIEDRYALSPIQQSMLDESLSAAAGSRIGLLQLVWDLPEALDPGAFEHAWQAVAERHPILRTRLVWRGPGPPFQEVVRRAPPPFAVADWSGLPPHRHAACLQSFLLEDRRRGLDLGRAPLLRVTVARLHAAHHRVVLTLHHTTFDGRTLLALIQEVFALYEALLAGRRAALPRPGPYRAYVEWLARQDRGRAELFWREALRGIREPTPLGIDRAERARGPAASAGGAPEVWLYQDFSVWLSAESTAALQQLARGLDLTLNTLLLGAWSLLLGRYSGRGDVLFGVVRTHRGAVPDGAAILGPLMGSLPFRATIDAAAELGPWLRALRARWLAMRAGDFASPADIRGWSELAPQAPFFETLVLFETHELTERLRQQGGAWRRRSFRFVRQSRVPLSIYGYLEERLSLKVIFDPGRFEPTVMRRLLQHLQTALEAMPRGVRRGATDLPLLSAPERQQLLVEWNDPTPGAPDWTVHTRFAEWARRAPEAVAVVDPCGSRTYGQIEESANRLAWLLRRRGVGPGTLVGVLLDRSLLEAQALLAILKAGGAYLPLESSAPERLDAILADSGAALLLTRSAVCPPLRFPAARLVDLDAAGQALSCQPASPPPGRTLPEQPAYVIYTSGSSGQPKGVVIPHRGLANLAAWHIEAFAVSSRDRASRLAGLGFDAAVWELWPAWCAGAAVILPPDEIRAAPKALRDWLLREEVSVCFAPTPLAERLVELSWPAAPRLRLLLTGGDTLRARPPAGLPFALINNYGPTESAVVATSGAVPAAPAAPAAVAAPGPARPPAIGRPIRNVRVFLLDADLRPVPVGAGGGEMTLAGAGLAQGYLGRPDLTAASFVPDPSGGAGAAGGGGGERLYRTGDLARLRPDGSFEFLGRRDAQLKIRGFRIEPGEIEAALGRHPSVQACAVIGRPIDPGAERQLVAFLVGRPGSARREDDLAAFLRGKLPPYMIPAVYRWLDSLPLSAHGKVDRRALEEQAAALAGEAPGYVPPATALEQLTARIWRDVLGGKPVGLHDDFFALGGHSLHATQVASSLRDLLARDVTVDLVFLASTVAQVVAHLYPSEPERLAAERLAAAVLARTD
jgi:amino acid adenylation domain-containing protein